MKKYILIPIIVVAIIVITLFVYQYYNKVKLANSSIDSSLSTIKNRGILLVGTNLPYAPMEYYDQSGNIVGFDIDLINLVAKYLGVQTEIKDVPWDTIFVDLNNKKFDILIDTITINAERLEKMMFSYPYMEGGQALVTHLDVPNFTNLEELAGKKITVLEETTGEALVKQYVDPTLVFSYADQDSVTENLKNKSTDVMVVDFVIATDIVKNNPEFKIMDLKLAKEFYGIAIRKGDNVLLETINNALKEIKKSGEMTALENKWLK